MENIQKQFTKKIAGLSELDYWQRLDKLKLLSNAGVSATQSYTPGRLLTTKLQTTSTCPFTPLPDLELELYSAIL